MADDIYGKLEYLKEYLQKLESVVIAFSGGVDSTFLLKVAHDLLGDRVIAVTAQSSTFPERETAEAKEFCKSEGILQVMCRSEELEIEGFCENPPNRCYFCKKELLGKIGSVAAEHGITYIAEGSNTDDNGDYRPGLAAVAELGVKSPLREAGLSKAEIRTLSKELGLPTWEKPSFACLASRFVYGEIISKEKLAMVDEAEQLLLDLGFHQVRVRMHGMLARIEVAPEEIARLTEPSVRDKVTAGFRKAGFSYVAVDLQGYRTGSMNEELLKSSTKI